MDSFLIGLFAGGFLSSGYIILGVMLLVLGFIKEWK